MFYSETLLSKTGPLARVWLAANLERKLTKNNIMQSNIESSVNAIVDQGQAPMALRLSGQLLLGVVRIYSRKARYLLDDCNEALLKLKMAFRPGNVDLPANQSHAVNPASLTLPDVLTELDLLAPMPDPSLLLSTAPELETGARDPTLLDVDTTDFLPGSIEQAQGAEEPEMLDDFGVFLDVGEGPTVSSVEIGRDNVAARRPEEEFGDEPTKLDDDDLGLDIDDEPLALNDPLDTSALPPAEDITMGGMDELPDAPPEENAAEQAVRATATPLSEIRASAEREVDTSTFQPGLEPEDESTLMHAQRATKRRRVLQADVDTELHSAQIRAQQDDRSKILKPASFIPRDPTLLALLNMQRTGGFVSNILGDGRSRGWAPELRGVLSLEVIRKSGERKRKRDSGIADVEGDSRSPSAERATPRLSFDAAEAADLEAGGASGLDFGEDEPGPVRDDSEEPMSPIDDGNFDDTTVPLLHPAESGPVSLGTKHAVHLLRDRFGPAAAEDPAERQKASVTFQDLLPEKQTSRADATKMFFEVLVLATKDAIKVDQNRDELGGTMRVRGKRGLWGAWAEERAGGEIATQTEEVAV